MDYEYTDTPRALYEAYDNAGGRHLGHTMDAALTMANEMDNYFNSRPLARKYLELGKLREAEFNLRGAACAQ